MTKKKKPQKKEIGKTLKNLRAAQSKPSPTTTDDLEFLLSSLGNDISSGKSNLDISIEREPMRQKHFPDLHPYALQVLMGIRRSQMGQGMPPPGAYKKEFITDDPMPMIQEIPQSSMRRRRANI